MLLLSPEESHAAKHLWHDSCDFGNSHKLPSSLKLLQLNRDHKPQRLAVLPKRIQQKEQRPKLAKLYVPLFKACPAMLVTCVLHWWKSNLQAVFSDNNPRVHPVCLPFSSARLVLELTVPECCSRWPFSTYISSFSRPFAKHVCLYMKALPPLQCQMDSNWFQADLSRLRIGHRTLTFTPQVECPGSFLSQRGPRFQGAVCGCSHESTCPK